MSMLSHCLHCLEVWYSLSCCAFVVKAVFPPLINHYIGKSGMQPHFVKVQLILRR